MAYNQFERDLSVIIYSSGRSPFLEWIESLDAYLSLAVDVRIARLRSGNFGDYKSLGGGLFELRIHKGPGLRIYYAFIRLDSILIMLGGDKNEQKKDIKKARLLWSLWRAQDRTLYSIAI